MRARALCLRAMQCGRASVPGHPHAVHRFSGTSLPGLASDGVALLDARDVCIAEFIETQHLVNLLLNFRRARMAA